MNKNNFRKKYLSLRTGISDEDLEDLSIAIANNSLKLPIWEFSNYHIFLPIINNMFSFGEVGVHLHSLQDDPQNLLV